MVLGGTIDATGMAGLDEFVKHYRAAYPIGAVDPNLMARFGQYGPQQRLLVPMICFIDKAGILRAQFMGGDELFEGDQWANLRKMIDHQMAANPSSTPSSAKAASMPAKK